MISSNFHRTTAGVGRTGVFITLSIVLERMQYEGVLDVFQTVRILRSQRIHMVQTEVKKKFNNGKFSNKNSKFVFRFSLRINTNFAIVPL
jgi:protein tyrosine phosphatase